jgi:hypothetical protein
MLENKRATDTFYRWARVADQFGLKLWTFEGRAHLEDANGASSSLEGIDILGRLETALDQLQEAARREEREAWRKWLAETRVAVAGQTFDPDSMIICGGKPTPKDSAQSGYAAACFAWEAAIRAREEG